MAYVPLPRFLFRAPLLPVRALRRPRERLAASPLGGAALALASPELAAALKRSAAAPATASALERYARRAAFRPTPHGFWAGVGEGHISGRTRLRTAAPVGRLAASWKRLADLGRALLERPEVRARARLRHAPSLNLGAHTMTWLAPGKDGEFCEEHGADLDDALVAVVDACASWTAWPAVRAALIDSSDDEAEADDWLLTLVDDGLLHVDVIPPLVGPEPGSWMAARLARIPEVADVARAFTTAQAALRRGALDAAQAALGALPDAAQGPASPALHGTLIFPAPSLVTLSRAVVNRAVALAPLLFRLQETLSPPSAERTPARAVAETLDAATEIFGAGAFDLAALARGDYGTSPAGDGLDPDDERVEIDPAPARPLVAFLLDRIVAAARDRDGEVSLRADELEPLVTAGSAPPTCELFLTPCRARPGLRQGSGWLLGLHAPAGASWGRFAAALGPASSGLYTALADAEARARPEEVPLDVVFAPNARLAELCAHPPVRGAALALTGWPDDGQDAIPLADLELVADPSALDPMALRRRDGGAVAPAPLHRVRSTTAPPGLWRTLVGWSLRRQHAPWALAFGPLAELAWLPRVTIDGFVVAPASWRIPAARSSSRRRLAEWRRTAGVPRFVQVGNEDELMPVDLASAGAVKQLAGHARLFEIWPPLDATPDESGRRVEAVIGLVDAPDDDARAFAAASAAATRAAGSVHPPGRGAPERAWRTFKLFGAAERQNAVLVEAVHPVVAAALEEGSIEGWFFQRYVDGPGRRPHLRLRVAGDATAFARVLDIGLAEACAAGDIVSVEETPYFPEAARFGGMAALPAIHALFRASSELVLALLAADDEGVGGDADGEDTLLLLCVAAHDALARAFGLDAAQRRAFALQRRTAHAQDVDDDFADAVARAFRTAKGSLRDLLGGGAHADPVSLLLRDFEKTARKAVAELTPATRQRSLPAIVHVDTVRLLGADREAEIRVYTFWERTLESLEHHPGEGTRRRPRP
ncbi:MAG TPA: thiopeptide-type bacteriocin biosynthesis protein [Polyangia bacterium]|jgi:thiopeptide-type bacteriocin biosynthesis protein